MVEDQPERDFVERDEAHAAPTPQEVAEAKRRVARRRFLMGGATAVSVVFSANRAKGQLTWTECVDLAPDGFEFLTNFIAFLRNSQGSYATFPNACSDPELLMQQMQQMSMNDP